MFCIECTKDCAMKYEKYMDIQTPCLVCIRGPEPATAECKKCINGDCQFMERTKNDV